MATKFLHTLAARVSFPTLTIQADGGSEFQAGCQERGIRVFVLPPR